MITGDENIVDIDFVVFWRISDAADYLFNIRNPDETIKMAAESVMRDIVGQTPIQEALTSHREDIESRTHSALQVLMTEYAAGIEVRSGATPRGVAAEECHRCFRRGVAGPAGHGQAQGTRPRPIAMTSCHAPAANRNSSCRAQRPYRQEVVNRAEGDANRFNSIYTAYTRSKEVTTKRIYLETLSEQVLSNVNKIIIDSDAGGSGVVPYLPTSRSAPAPGGVRE